MKIKSNRKGFTLIELVIVVAVLAILAVVAVPAVNGIVKDSKDASDKAQLALIQSAIERYNAKEGKYPKVMDASGVSGTATKTAVIDDAVKVYTNLDTIPACQQEGYEFYYDASTGKVSYAQSGAGLIQLN